ncbi:MAG: GGDEF domain-containing protein [Micavibrio sp.]|nr:GGDEF domain-containing protein [Micavibrio sp.]
MVRNLSREEFEKYVKINPAILKRFGTTAEKMAAFIPMELTREQDFIDGDKDIFDLLNGSQLKSAELAESIGSTLALLKRSGQMLQQAEDKILAQQERLDTLENIAYVDEESGLLNRRAFIAQLKREVARAERNKEEGGLIVMFNLENTTKIRKNHGKDAVKTAVRLLAKALQGEIRDCDYAARLSDEEFVILFTKTDMGRALTRLQNMALRLNKLSLLIDGEEINLNLSLGLKSYNPSESAEDIFAAVSGDLNRNRKTGKTTKA